MEEALLTKFVTLPRGAAKHKHNDIKDLYGGLFCYDNYMSKKSTPVEASAGSVKDAARVIMYVILLLPGFAYAFMWWFSAGMSLCGISGCSGGGFGVSYNPEAVKHALIMSGIAAASGPFIILLISRSKKRWTIITLATLVLVPALVSMSTGAGFDGYPIHRIR